MAMFLIIVGIASLFLTLILPGGEPFAEIKGIAWLFSADFWITLSCLIISLANWRGWAGLLWVVLPFLGYMAGRTIRRAVISSIRWIKI